MAEDTLAWIRDLSHAAAKLYIYLDQSGGRYRTKADLMRGAGIAHRRTLNYALEELEIKGLWSEEGVASTPKRVATTPFDVASTPFSVASTRVASTPKRVLSTPPGVASTPPDLDTLIEAADAMPADGLETVKGSNFGLRRQQQTDLLVRAWAQFFPNQPALLPANAKVWIRECGNTAYPAYLAMEEVAARGDKVTSPLGYMKRVVPDMFAKLQVKKAEEEPFEKGEVTETDRAAWAKAEEYAALLGEEDWRTYVD